MTKDEYMEAHHHITESGIGLLRVYMAAERHDMAWSIMNKMQDELTDIHKQRMQTLTSLGQPLTTQYTCDSPDGCHCGGDTPRVRAGCYHYKEKPVRPTPPPVREYDHSFGVDVPLPRCDDWHNVNRFTDD